MGSFGENLRREREARGITLDDISRITKISVRLLQAIEEEDFDRLPGGVFNVNFVRQYARQVGLDEERVVEEFRGLVAEEEAEAAGAGGGVWNESSGPAEEYDWDAERRIRLRNWGAVVLGGAAAIGLAAYVWLGRRSVSGPAAAPAPPPVAASEPPAPAAQPAPAPAATAPESSATAAAEPKTAPGEEVKAPPPGTPPAAPQEPRAAKEPAPPPDLNAPVRVELVATDEVWVAASSDGKPVFTTTLAAEQKRMATAQERVRIRVGNAGALKVFLNGQEQPPIGPRGQPRTVLFTAEGMQVVPPPEKPATPPENPAKETP